MLIEVSDSTLQYDLGVKARLYATHKVPEHWVVGLVAKRVWRHRDPRGTEYTGRTEIVDGEIELPNSLGAINVSELF